MSEEQRKEKQKPKVISSIALIVGIAMFLCGLFLFGNTWLTAIGYSLDSRGDVLWTFLFALVFCSLRLGFLPAPIGLVLSIVTLFIERSIYFRLLPLIFVLAGILLYFIFVF